MRGGEWGGRKGKRTYHFSCSFRGIDESSSNKVGNSSRSSNGHGKGDLIRDGSECSNHALSSKILGAKASRHERHDFKSKPFRLNHDHARQRKLDHDPPVRQSSPTEAAPALRTINEFDVQEQEDGEEGLGDGYGGRGADEAPVQVPHEEPVDEDVDGGDNDEDPRRRLEQALRLREALPALEEDEAGDAEDHDAEVEAGETGRFGLGDDLAEDVLGVEPDDRDGDTETE